MWFAIFEWVFRDEYQAVDVSFLNVSEVDWLGTSMLTSMVDGC